MAGLRIRKLGYALGAEVTGVDLTRPLDDATIAQIRKAWVDNIVICIPGQDLAQEQMMATCARFGELYDHRSSPENTLPGFPTIKVLSNKAVEVDGKGYSGYRTGRKWHSDSSFDRKTATATFLLAQELPDVGGDTGFANMYLAYETLSPAMQALIEPLSAIHDHTLSGNYHLKTPELIAADALISPPVVHPAVRVHEETGRKALFVNPRVRRFVGMTEEESKPILDFLQGHSTRYEFLYRHRWAVGDFVMWDNRSAMHIAIQDYDQKQVRRMLRCTILGPATGRLHSADDEARLVSLR
jgi:taurine dioxygenase